MNLKQNWCWFLLCLGVGFIPLYVWSFTNGEPVEIQKVRFTLGFIELITAAICIEVIWNPKKRQDWWQKISTFDRKSLFALLALLSVVVVSSVLGVNLFKSTVGNHYRADGLITLFHLAWFAGIVALLSERKYELWLWRSIGVGSLAVSLQAIFSASVWWQQTGGGGFGDWQGAQGGTFGQPQFLAGWLVVSLPVLWWLQKCDHFPLTWIWRAAVALQLAAMVPTLTRASVLGVGTWVAVTMILMSNRARPYLGKMVVGASIATAMCIAMWLIWTYDHPPTDFYPEGRERIFIHIAQSLVERPLIGWGWANTDAAFQNGSWPYVVRNDVYVDKAHSVFFEYLATTGIVGLATYLSLLSIVWQKIAKHESAPLLMSVFIVYIVHSQMNIISIAEELLFWMLVGFALIRARKKLPT